MRYMIGIDAGTSNVKAVLFDEEGNEVLVKSKESHTYHDKGEESEQDMEMVWENAKSCLKEVVAAGLAKKEEIAGIGVCGQGEGCWLIDAEGKPLQRAPLWCDGRATEIVEKVTKENPEIGQYYYTSTGCRPLLGNQMILLRWMKDNRKEILDKADKVLFCKDWIRYHLTGKIGAELTDSATSLVDVQTEKISEKLLEKMELSDYRKLIPNPARSDEIAGSILDDLADEIGLMRGTPVIYGALDTSSTAVGLGTIHEGDVSVILGTTCGCQIVMEKESCLFGEPDTRYEKHPLGNLYVELQPTLNGTPNIDWMVSEIADGMSYEEINEIVDSVPLGCGGVVYLPYISVAGERSPFYHPYARAEFFGISNKTTKGHLIRAVYEGLSMSIRDCLLHADRSGVIRLAGGGAKSPVWAQMIADAMGMKVMISEGKEIGAKGVAMMVGVRTGIYKDYEEAVRRTCRISKIYEPNEIRTKQYDLLFELYKSLRLSNTETWNYRHMMNKKINALAELGKN